MQARGLVLSSQTWRGLQYTRGTDTSTGLVLETAHLSLILPLLASDLKAARQGTSSLASPMPASADQVTHTSGMLRAKCHPTFGSGSGRGVSNVAVSIVRAPRLSDRSAISSAKGLRSRCTCTHGQRWWYSCEHRDTLSSRRARQRCRSASPAAAKLLVRQQGPWHCILGHRYAASNRVGLRCAVSPCLRPRLRGACSRGG